LALQHEIERRSAALKKELGTRDLVFTQILYIVGLNWVGTAAKIGASHMTFWLLGLTLFYLPSCVVVIHLNRQMPLEGGVYQWAKLRFNEMTGFLVAWNLWLYAILILSTIGVRATDMLAYGLGSSGAWIANDKWIIALTSTLATAGLMVVASIGLTLGKWIHNFGGFCLIGLLAAMLFFAVPHWVRGEVQAAPMALTFPAISLFSLNILGKMGFGALGGFDGVAIFAGECRDPVRSAWRSVWVAAPIIGAIFILGTACVLVFSRPDNIDLVSPITQVLSLGASSMGSAAIVVRMAVALILSTFIAQMSLLFSGAIRLPMVAGWDHLLPDWFSRLHPLHRTPTGSVLFIGGLTLAFALATTFDSGNQEAFQLLENAGGISFAIAYMVMFAIPLLAPVERPSWGVRVAAASGFLMTLLYSVLSVFPIIEVKSGALFTAKIIGVIAGANVAGAVFYWRAELRRDRAAGD
jgi:glutamate:GABA antiporter